MIFDHLPCSLIFSEFLVIFMLFQDFLDPFFRVQQMADGGIVIQRVDPVSYTHLDVYKRQEVYQ